MSIDWQAVRERLARAHAAAEASLELPAGEGRARMDERARALARPLPQATSGQHYHLLSFSLGGERYAIGTAYLREVIRLLDFTPVPGAGDFVFGVTNLRGEVLCILDLRKIFRLPSRGLSEEPRVLVVGREQPELGILADEALEAFWLPAADILETPASVTPAARSYLLGVTRQAMQVLDGAKLLNDNRLFVDQKESG
ncbi:MAG: purine-binding chemotaxis protein CheW [Candidatus Eremiobacteraeota bacterium]|nr:purine-binding chemotaxis protein CheW [Candidatus Eremiobacteraeota bacterium]